MEVIGILSPGDMGAAVARVLSAGGAQVVTCLSGRSPRTLALAEAAGITCLDDDDELVRRADLILSIVPPDQAAGVGKRVVEAVSLRDRDQPTVFADCNAIAPATVVVMANQMCAAGIEFVDAGIIGPPPTRKGMTRFYASGAEGYFEQLAGFGLDVHWLGADVGSASALKMCYAASTKGFVALCTELLAAAETLRVSDALQAEFALSQPDLMAKLERLVPAMPSKSHRWIGEMEQIAQCFSDVGLTPLMLQGAADLYRLAATIPAAALTPEQPELFPEVTEVARQIAGAITD